MAKFKELYTPDYVSAQLEKFRNRHHNHWRYHIRLAKSLTLKYAPKPPAKVLDLGCSIGTFALELAKDGYESIGLDFDPKALKQAEILAQEIACSPKWECQDATSFTLNKPVDFVVCFDLLEHLTNKMIMQTLIRVKENLVIGGVFIFHTFPTEFDHLFYKHPMICLLLIPFKNMPEKVFTKITHFYATILNLYYLARYMKTYKRHIKSTVHPNPLSVKRLKKFLIDSGFEILILKTSLDDINPLKPGQGKLAKKYFASQPVAQRSIWGVAVKGNGV